MSEPAVVVEGLDRLVRTLNKAKVDIGDLKDAHKRVGEIVASEAAMVAPRRTGKLAGTIRAARQAKRAQVIAGRASVPYAAPIHWGWPARNIAAQPFLADAAVSTEPRWTVHTKRTCRRHSTKSKEPDVAWQRFRVQLKGEAAPIEVQTSARDYSTVVMDPNAPKALDFQFRITHNALVRTGVDGVPRDYDSFLEVLDGIPEAVDDEDPDVLTPTPPDR